MCPIGLRTTIILDDSLKCAPIAVTLTIRSGADGRLLYRLRREPGQITGLQLEPLIEQINVTLGAGIDLQRAEIVAGRYP